MGYLYLVCVQRFGRVEAMAGETKAKGCHREWKESVRKGMGRGREDGISREGRKKEGESTKG